MPSPPGNVDASGDDERVIEQFPKFTVQRYEPATAVFSNSKMSVFVAPALMLRSPAVPDRLEIVALQQAAPADHTVFEPRMIFLSLPLPDGQVMFNPDSVAADDPVLVTFIFTCLELRTGGDEESEQVPPPVGTHGPGVIAFDPLLAGELWTTATETVPKPALPNARWLIVISYEFVKFQPA